MCSCSAVTVELAASFWVVKGGLIGDKGGGLGIGGRREGRLKVAEKRFWYRLLVPAGQNREYLAKQRIVGFEWRTC